MVVSGRVGFRVWAGLALFTKGKCNMRLPPELKDFVDNAPWKFAESYTSTWPHFYIMKEWVKEDLFAKLVEHINRYGHKERFYKRKYIYFDEDGLTYWTMGDIINRSPKENSYENRLKKRTLPEKIH